MTGSRDTATVEFEYIPHGTLAYFGAYDVHHTRLMGRDRADHRHHTLSVSWCAR
jgi:hypothetical protein